ncbi:tetratricopeptide repeat protein [Bacteriovorax sp. Seq25_V]|uniref:tetratricopeptide repeat protein n=1 Tax=Bacteriovorax sp. Seq25_V TaxID=1201288 RepID=UPI000389ECD2|nr:tetratricopeptide repeat protein [Bacteriovorax sp. Seq25_V]EQC47233.1 tetratricopeptide repeat protein [Bacteriovorax sp. Seq25_V]
MKISPKILLLLLLIITSCAQKQIEKPVSVETVVKSSPSEEVKNMESAVLAKEKIEQHLSSIVEEALRTGDEAVNYLSSDLFLKANDASLKGDAFSASIIFKAIVRLKPEDLYLRKRFAVELIKSNQLEDAKEHLDYLIGHGDAELAIKAKLLLAGIYSAMNNTDKSIALYKEIVAKKGGELPEACAFLSKAYSRDGKFKRAFSVLDYCASKSSENKASFLYYKARIEFERDRMKSAIKLLERSIASDENFFQSVLLLGHIHEMSSKKDKAAKVYEKFLTNNPTNYSVLTKYVDILFSEGQYVEVIPYLEKLVSIDESNLNLKVRLGVLYTEVSRVEEAKSIFQEILKDVPESDKVLYYLASLYQQTSENDKAIEYFSRIPEGSALFHESHIQIAQILNAVALENTKSSDKLFEFVSKNAKKSNVLNVELNVILAGFLEASKDYTQAISVLENIRSLSEFSDGHEYYLAALYERVQDFSKADKLINSMLKKNPNNAHALNFLGYSILERGGDMKKAYDYISKAVKLRPQDGYIRDSLSWYYYKMGKYTEAYEESKKAMKLVGNDVVITKHLALIYKAMNNYDKAKEYYVEALKNCKISAEREDVIKELEDLESVRLPASVSK